jgi:hypothetical protein
MGRLEHVQLPEANSPIIRASDQNIPIRHHARDRVSVSFHLRH